MTHGTHYAYGAGCRCDLCRTAERARWSRKRPARKVSAERCRRHLQRLQAAGLGSPAIAACCDVSPGRIIAIRNGKVSLIWKRTADRILSVSDDGIADGARVPAAPYSAMLRELIDDGYTREELGREMGYARTTVCNLLYTKRITARTALRIEKLYERAQLMRLGVAA